MKRSRDLLERERQSGLIDDVMSYARVSPPDADGWWIAESPRLRGAFTQGRSRLEALRNLRSGVKDLLDTYAIQGARPPLVRVR